MKAKNILTKIIIVVEIILAIVLIYALVDALKPTHPDAFFDLSGLLWEFAKITILPVFIANFIFLLLPKKNVSKLIILVVITVAICNLINNLLFESEIAKSFKPVEIDKVLDDEYTEDMLVSHFFHNNKLYYYRFDDAEFNDGKGTLFKSNLSGENNKKLCNLNFDASFEYVYSYGDNIYVMAAKESSDEEGLRKLNLNTCKTTNLMKNNSIVTYDYDIDYDINDNKIILAIDSENDKIDDLKVLYKYDLKTNKLIESKKINCSGSIDCDNSILYGDTMSYYSMGINNKVYKNGKVILNYTGLANNILLCKDNLMYLYDENNIYKFDINTNKLIDTTSVENKKIYRLNSVSGDYFYIDSNIYTFNIDTNEFELLISNVHKKARKSQLYKYNDKYIFINYEKPYISIYGKNGKKIYEKGTLYDVQIDNTDIYLVYKNKKIEKINLDKISNNNK